MYFESKRKETFFELIIYILLIWFVFLLQQFTNITQYGIQPRSMIGLIGIISAPFLHSDINHIWMNTSALFIFGTLYSVVEGKRITTLFWFILILGGIFTWLLASNGNHIGSSGVVFGLFGFSISIGFFHKKIKYILLSISVIFLYSSMLFGLTPITDSNNISWESHIFGFVAGIIVAKYKEY